MWSSQGGDVEEQGQGSASTVGDEQGSASTVGDEQGSSSAVSSAQGNKE
jgi:hypothetical protein